MHPKPKAVITPGAATAKSRKLMPGLSIRDGYTPHPFDLEFSVKTSGLIAGRHLATGHRHDRHATAYYGVAPSVFKALIRRWQKSSPSAINQTTFIDLGAGMGRALLLASQFEFKQVIGVELHPMLANIAQKNLRLWHAAGRDRSPARIVIADAAEFSLPDGPLLIFLFNPFSATLLRRVMRSWHKSLADGSAAADILYVNNEQDGVLESEPRWRRIFLGKIRRSKTDAIADHRIMANQPEGEYTSSNWEDCSIWRYTARP